MDVGLRTLAVADENRIRVREATREAPGLCDKLGLTDALIERDAEDVADDDCTRVSPADADDADETVSIDEGDTVDEIIEEDVCTNVLVGNELAVGKTFEAVAIIDTCELDDEV